MEERVGITKLYTLTKFPIRPEINENLFCSLNFFAHTEKALDSIPDTRNLAIDESNCKTNPDT